MDRFFAIDGGRFVKDGEDFRILSGEIHYFRITKPQWADRLQKLKNFGCNTVSTAVPWVIHEPDKGSFNFSEGNDLGEFLKIAHELGLNAILRIGPFTGCDIDRGGLPGWLYKEEPRVYRSCDVNFMKYVRLFFSEISKIVTPLLYVNGGPVIMIQLEQEYRSYGLDEKYIEQLVSFGTSLFPGTQLFTADMPDSLSSTRGNQNLFTAVNFGTNAKDAFSKAEIVEPGRPKFCMELWTGWQDSWTGAHYVRTAESMAKVYDELLSANASVNIYMFAGGTNFGFLAGAVLGERFEPGTTSYDYDALISECGDCTEKYYHLREVLAKHEKIPPLAKASSTERFEKKNIIFPRRATFFQSVSRISSPVKNRYPLSMEAVGLFGGFMLYRTTIQGPMEDGILSINGLHDRALVFINERYSETLYCNDSHIGCVVDFEEQRAQIDILVENMGGLSNSLCSLCNKGITGDILLNGRILFDWEMLPFPMESLEGIPFVNSSSQDAESQPSFYQAMFTVERPKDSFLALRGWKKGLCYINGFNLGRYWNEGPQQNLYVPYTLLRKGKNEITLFELYRPSDLSIEFVTESHYGRKSPIRKSIASRMQQFLR